MGEDYASYVITFQEKLGSLVDISLGLENPIMGGIKSTAMYGIDIPIAAAMAGFELELPHEVAIAYMVLAQGIQKEKNFSRISLLFSKNKREEYNEYISVVKNSKYIIDELSQKSTGEKFMDLMVKHMAEMLAENKT